MSIEALQASMPQSLAHFFARRRARRPARGRRPRLSTMPAPPRRRNSAPCWPRAVAHLGCSRRRARRSSTPRRISASALSVDQDQFLSMAKIRALRKLWARVQAGLRRSAPSPRPIHAETSYRMMTAGDPETNILRTTIAGFAAARRRRRHDLGPAAHDRARPAGRLCAPHRAQHAAAAWPPKAISTSSPIPASGSGSVEALTDALCAAAWKEFQTHRDRRRHPEKPGRRPYPAPGARSAAKRRAKLYRNGERQIVGTTLYPPAAERPVETLDGRTAAGADRRRRVLRPARCRSGSTRRSETRA